MLVILFGQSAAGKNYVGKILAAQFGYYFWDADLALTPAMHTCIRNKQVFTQAMRDEFTQRIIDRITALSKTHRRLVVSQALYKEKNRKQLAAAFPHALFIRIHASPENILLRLAARNNAVDTVYANKILAEFEVPTLPHQVIRNDTNQADIVKQLRVILP